MLRHWRSGRFELIVSPALLEQIEPALAYPKIRRRFPAEAASRLLRGLEQQASVTDDPGSAPVRCIDPGDDYLSLWRTRAEYSPRVFLEWLGDHSTGAMSTLTMKGFPVRVRPWASSGCSTFQELPAGGSSGRAARTRSQHRPIAVRDYWTAGAGPTPPCPLELGTREQCMSRSAARERSRLGSWSRSARQAQPAGERLNLQQPRGHSHHSAIPMVTPRPIAAMTSDRTTITGPYASAPGTVAGPRGASAERGQSWQRPTRCLRSMTSVSSPYLTRGSRRPGPKRARRQEWNM